MILIKLLCMMDFIILAKKNSINNLLEKKTKSNMWLFCVTSNILFGT